MNAAPTISKIPFVLIAAFLAAPGAFAAERAKYPKQAKQPPPAAEEVQSEEIKTESDAAEEAKPSADAAAKPEIGAGGIEAAAEEGKPFPEQFGPRQGILRDAGRFKVELKPGKSGVDVYLVNSAQGSPIVEGSRVEGQLYVGKKEYELKFRPIPGQRKFHAPWPEKVGAEELDGAKGGKEVALVLLPTRERIVGAPVLYKIEKLQE